jgi:hypothetical protein
VQRYTSYQSHRGSGGTHTLSFTVSTTTFQSYRYYRSYCSACSTDAAFLNVVSQLCAESSGCAGFNYFAGGSMSSGLHHLARCVIADWRWLARTHVDLR